MTTRRRNRVLSWLIVGVFYLIVRLWSAPFAFDDGRTPFNDTDPFYRLHRVQKMIDGSLFYPLKDPALSPPTGFAVPWPLGLDLIYALPMKALGLSDRAKMEKIIAVSIPFLSLPALFFVMASAGLMSSPGVGLVAGIAFSLFEPQLTYSQIGAFDHHVLESLFPILLFFLFLQYRRTPKRRIVTILGLILGVSTGFWPQAWIMGVFLGLAFLVLRTKRASTSVDASAVFMISGLASLLWLLFSDRFFSGWISLLGFSWWSPLLFFFLGTGFSFLALIDRLNKRRLLLTSILFLSLLSIGIFTSAQNLGKNVSTIRPFQTATDVLTAGKGTISTTSEAGSVWHAPLNEWGDRGALPLVLALLFCSYFLFRNERSLAAFAIIPLLLPLIQNRFIGMAAPFIFVWVTVGFFRWFGEKKIRFTSQRPLLWTAALVALVTVPAAPTFSRASIGNIHPFFKPVQEVSKFLQEEKVRLNLNAEGRRISAHWEFGHWLLYYADAPVIAHPFQSSESTETLRLFISDGVSSLKTYNRKYGNRYLVAEAPTGRLQRWMKVFGKDSKLYFSSVASSANGESLEAKDKFYDLFLPRFFIGHGINRDGDHPEEWRLIYVSSFASPDSNDIPALKLFEKVNGARITADPALAENALIRARIRTTAGEWVFIQKPKRLPDGRFQWIVPYARTDRGGVLFDGRYEIVEKNRGTILSVITVDEEMVLSGETLQPGRAN